MDLQVLAYPFLFVAIFFESFILVTLLSKPARDARARHSATTTPSVAVIVPCYNEESTIAHTCESLLSLDYPREKLEIILVNDGSTDGTSNAMNKFVNHPQVKIIQKENGGKHTALNAGIAETSAEIVGCLDADSFVESDALREIIPCFENEKIAAVTAAMSVHKPKNLIQHMQNAEYIFGITVRHTLASVNGLYVTPGPFSFYKRDVIEKLGGFRHGHQTEDMEMALRIQKAGYAIENAPRARVYTKAPGTVAGLIKQRTRWTAGFLRNVIGEYRGLVWNRGHAALGMLVLPIALTAIISSILLFSIAIFKVTSSVINAIEIRMGIPFSYSIMSHDSFGWFYIPSSLYLFLGIATLLASFSFIAVGKKISKTPGNIILGLLSYTILYGLVAPLWLIRATSDVIIGKNRNWR